MRNIQFGIAILLLSLVISCSSSYKIISDKETGVNFSKYSTFDITDHEHGFPVGANPINKQRIERAIIKELESIGISQAKNSKLVVAWFVKMRTKEEVSIYRNYYKRWEISERVDIYQYQEGSLVIDLIDSETNKVIWHARAVDRVYDNMPDIENKINSVVHEMIQRYKKDTKYKPSDPFASMP